jgi:hypothetical protein
MKTILTVVFVTSIFTLFVQSATAMPPNQWHSEVYDKNLRSWMLVIQRKVTEQSKFKDFKRLVGERTIQVTCRLTTESDLGDIQLVTSSRSDEAEQVVLLLLRKVSSVPKPPSGIPLQKKLLIVFNRLGLNVDFVPFDSWGPSRFL